MARVCQVDLHERILEGYGWVYQVGHSEDVAGGFDGLYQVGHGESVSGGHDKGVSGVYSTYDMVVLGRPW
jgi:hypothetical protein